MSEEGVVVERHLRVEGEQVAFLGDDQRIDLDERGVGFDKGLPHRVHQLPRLRNLGPVETERERELARLEPAQADAGIDELFEDAIRCFFGNLLDLHATVGARHHHRPFAGSVDDETEIQLPLDLEPLLDQHTAHLLTRRSGLMGHERHAQDLGGRLSRFLRALDDFDAATLAAAPRVDLRLDDGNAIAEPSGHGLRLLRRTDHLPLRHRHTVPGKNGLRLILVDFHERNLSIISRSVHLNQARERYEGSKCRRGVRL